MRKEDAAKLPKYNGNPIFDGMPAYLKDPKNYEKIQKTLLDEIASGHSHSEIIGWYNCVDCQKKVQKRHAMMKKLGFKSPQQYLEWRKVHEKIRELMPLRKYND